MHQTSGLMWLLDYSVTGCWPSGLTVYG